MDTYYCEPPVIGSLNSGLLVLTNPSLKWYNNIMDYLHDDPERMKGGDQGQWQHFMHERQISDRRSSVGPHASIPPKGYLYMSSSLPEDLHQMVTQCTCGNSFTHTRVIHFTHYHIHQHSLLKAGGFTDDLPEPEGGWVGCASDIYSKWVQAYMTMRATVGSKVLSHFDPIPA